MRLLELKSVGWMFYCPGCKCSHYFDSRWSFNDNQESPTFQPSLLCTTGWAPKRRIIVPDTMSIPSEMLPDHVGDTISMNELKHVLKCETRDEISKIVNDFFDKQPKHVCHSFVTDGKIQFLSDCTHDLAGQTVDMVDIDTMGDDIYGR